MIFVLSSACSVSDQYKEIRKLQTFQDYRGDITTIMCRMHYFACEAVRKLTSLPAENFRLEKR